MIIYTRQSWGNSRAEMGKSTTPRSVLSQEIYWKNFCLRKSWAMKVCDKIKDKLFGSVIGVDNIKMGESWCGDKCLSQGWDNFSLLIPFCIPYFLFQPPWYQHLITCRLIFSTGLTLCRKTSKNKIIKCENTRKFSSIEQAARLMFFPFTVFCLFPFSPSRHALLLSIKSTTRMKRKEKRLINK